MRHYTSAVCDGCDAVHPFTIEEREFEVEGEMMLLEACICSNCTHTVGFTTLAIVKVMFAENKAKRKTDV